jgi:cytochrome c biogenesis protein CcmG, thiol:disulfide interchange protein DsbE
LKRLHRQKPLILFACLLSLSLFFGCSPGEKQSSGAPAPDFTLKTLEGEEMTLSKLEGKVIILDFWATWCGPCRDSIPHMVQLYNSSNEKGVEILGMNLDKGSVEGVRSFVKAMNIPYPIVLSSDEVARNYRVQGIPTCVVIDKKGKVRHKYVGFSTAIVEQLSADAKTLLAEDS